MHKWLQLPATPTDDPLATVYPINHYKKSSVYAVTRINPIYVDDEVQPHVGTWNNNKSGSSGYDSQPQSDHSSLDKNSPPASKVCLRDETSTPSDGKGAAPSWLSPIKEGVVDVHQYRIPRPVWPGHRNAAAAIAAGRVSRPKCCRHCARCRCRSDSTSSGYSVSSADSGVKADGGKAVAAIGGSGSGRYTASYSSSAYGGSAGGTISTSTTTSTSVGRVSGDGFGSCSDDAAAPSSGTESVESSDLQLQQSSPLALDPHYGDGVNKTLVNNWNSVDLRLNQKTDNLHYDCGAMLRGLQFTLDAQQAEKLMQKIKVGKKHRCWCRFVTACLGLIMFLVSVVTVSLALTRGQKMFGSL